MTARVDAAWQAFRRMCVPATAGLVQVEETRRAFFSGAATVFYAMVGGVSPGMDDPTEADMCLMTDLDEELKAYAAEIESQAAKAHGGRR